jgi:hypothetical protein
MAMLDAATPAQIGHLYRQVRANAVKEFHPPWLVSQPLHLHDVDDREAFDVVVNESTETGFLQTIIRKDIYRQESSVEHRFGQSSDVGKSPIR